MTPITIVGRAYFKKGSYDEAVVDFTTVIGISAEATAYQHRGDAYCKPGKNGTGHG